MNKTSNSEKLKGVIIGFSLDHVNAQYSSFAAHPEEVEFIGWADVAPGGGAIPGNNVNFKKNVHFDIGCEISGDWRKLIELKPDFALVCCDKKSQTSVICELIENGIGVIIEKPMACDFDDAAKIVKASVEHSVMLCVNWPVAWFPSFNLAKKLYNDGVIGKMLRFQYRTPATLGPYSYGNDLPPEEKAKTWWYTHELGGGSLLDYGCYGCLLATWFAGDEAVEAFGQKTNFMVDFANVEDYASFGLRFPSSLAQLEGSWSTVSSGGIPTGPIVFGEKGTIVCDRYTDEVKLYLGLRSKEPSKVYKAEPLKETLASQVIAHLRDGSPLRDLIDAKFNLSVMSALDAAIRSCDSGRVEKLKKL